MCTNMHCHLKETCYRFKATPSIYQSYADFKPYVNANEDMDCDHYWELKPIHKYNNGNSATLCHSCRTIIKEKFINQLFCNKCDDSQDNKTPD